MTRPRLNTDLNLLPGLIAVGLFGVLAATFLSANFPQSAGFGADAEITRSIGAALISIDPAAVVNEGTAIASEGFLVALILVAVALDAALDGSILLARREDDEAGEAVTDGGTPTDHDADLDAAGDTDGGVN